MNELLKSNITFLQDVRKPGVFTSIPLGEALRSVRNGKYKALVSGARTALLIGDGDEYARLKKTLPSFCYHGTFKDRVANNNFIASSSLFHIDIDKISGNKLTETLEILKADPHTVFAYISPSEEGLKAAFRVDPDKIKSDDDFKIAFSQIAAYLSEKSITIDPSCKDIRRVSFVSHDPALFYNRNPQVFELNTQIALEDNSLADLPVYEDDYDAITAEDSETGICSNITLENAAQYLPEAGSQTYQQWLDVGFMLHHQFQGSDEAMALFDTWSQGFATYDAQEVVYKWTKSFGKRKNGKNLTFRSLIKAYNDSHEKECVSRDSSSIKAAHKLISACDDYLELTRNIAPKLWKLADRNVALEKEFTEALMIRYAELNPSKPLTKIEAARAMKVKRGHEKTAAKSGALMPDLVPDDSGKFPSTISNVLAGISSFTCTGVHLGFDAFTDSIMFHSGDSQWEDFSDVHYTDIKLALDKHNFHDVHTERVREIVRKVAFANHFDSAQLWLEALKWDKKPRVEKFLENYLGAERGHYSRAVSKYLWTALAGRVLSPGCQVDMVPVLVGLQGCGKSQAVNALVPDKRFYCDMSFKEKEDDLSRKFRGRLVAEIGELKGLNSKDDEHIKALISRSTETWTPKYVEFVTNYPRRIVMIGTTNVDQILIDPTGNRRWLPFWTKNIKVDDIRRDRELLWAEAAVLYASEGVHWEEAQTLAIKNHTAFEVAEDWQEPIKEWLESEADGLSDKPDISKGVSFLEILNGALNIETRYANNQQYKRSVHRVMINLGYEQRIKRRDGAPGRYWFKIEDDLI